MAKLESVVGCYSSPADGVGGGEGGRGGAQMTQALETHWAHKPSLHSHTPHPLCSSTISSPTRTMLLISVAEWFASTWLGVCGELEKGCGMGSVVELLGRGNGFPRLDAHGHFETTRTNQKKKTQTTCSAKNGTPGDDPLSVRLVPLKQ